MYKIKSIFELVFYFGCYLGSFSNSDRIRVEEKSKSSESSFFRRLDTMTKPHKSLSFISLFYYFLVCD